MEITKGVVGVLRSFYGEWRLKNRLGLNKENLEGGFNL